MGSRVRAPFSPDRFPVATRGQTRSPKKAVGRRQRTHIGLVLASYHALQRVAEEFIIVRKPQAWKRVTGGILQLDAKMSGCGGEPKWDQGIARLPPATGFMANEMASNPVVRQYAPRLFHLNS
mgnify:CR=1 FL=1|jgi:hypothetical protein